jgi:hypothetical protein
VAVFERNSVVSGGARHQANHEQDPAQKFGTAGIKPIDRPSLVTRFFMSIVACAEQLNLPLSKVGNPSIYARREIAGPWLRGMTNGLLFIQIAISSLPVCVIPPQKPTPPPPR